MPIAADKGAEVIRVYCYECNRGCTLLATVREGRIIKVRGNPQDAITRGFICPKGAATLERFYHPDRLHYPLKRVGERGEGKWQRISWEEALDAIAAKLRDIKERCGAEAVAHAKGTTHGPDSGIGVRFFNLFGSPNVIGPGIACAGPNLEADSLTFGIGPTWGVPLRGKTRCVVLWGQHPAACNPLYWKNALACQKEGAKIIVIDPRRTPEAAKADIWLQPRPGTDGALALGWLNVILEEELFDKEFVAKWTVGFSQLRERLQEYSPQKVAEITWVPREKIIEAARTYATNTPGVIRFGMGVAQAGRNTLQSERARSILRAITGSLDVPGGTKMDGPHKSFLSVVEEELPEKLSPQQRRKILGGERFRLHTLGYEMLNESLERVWHRKHLLGAHWASCASAPALWRAILTEKPYPVKALLVNANNVLGCYGNLKMAYKALKSPNLELLVVMDLFRTPTAELADYLLPAAHWLEKSNLFTPTGDNPPVATRRSLTPQYEHKADYDFFYELALRLGYAEHWPSTLEALWQERLAPGGVAFEDFASTLERRPAVVEYKKYEKIDPAAGKPVGFGTPSGKVELYSSILEKLGYDALPHYAEPGESPVTRPDLAAEYPLLLITGGTSLYTYHQDHRQIPSLRRKLPYPLVEIHPQTAGELGIEEGEWVFVETVRGRVRQRAHLTPRIHPKVVQADRWWYPEEPGAEPSLRGVWLSNINICTDDELEDCDPAYGTWQNRALMCKVYKAPAPPLTTQPQILIKG